MFGNRFMFADMICETSNLMVFYTVNSTRSKGNVLKKRTVNMFFVTFFLVTDCLLLKGNMNDLMDLVMCEMDMQQGN